MGQEVSLSLRPLFEEVQPCAAYLPGERLDSVSGLCRRRLPVGARWTALRRPWLLSVAAVSGEI